SQGSRRRTSQLTSDEASGVMQVDQTLVQTDVQSCGGANRVQIPNVAQNGNAIAVDAQTNVGQVHLDSAQDLQIDEQIRNILNNELRRIEGQCAIAVTVQVDVGISCTGNS